MLKRLNYLEHSYIMKDGTEILFHEAAIVGAALYQGSLPAPKDADQSQSVLSNGEPFLFAEWTDLNHRYLKVAVKYGDDLCIALTLCLPLTEKPK